MSAFPRRVRARVLRKNRPSKNRRGRRECRVMASPMARLQQKTQAAVTTGLAGQPAFPAQWVTAYTRSPRGAGLSCPRRSRDHLATLASASGGRDHAISPSASATFVRRAVRVHRIPAPRIVTIGRNVPLHRGGMRENIVVICPTRQALTRATDWHDGQKCAWWGCGSVKTRNISGKLNISAFATMSAATTARYRPFLADIGWCRLGGVCP
jgi:hypothetical protein